MGGSRTPTRAYVRPGLVYMAGSERRNGVIVFIRSQPAWTEQPIETRPRVPQNRGNGLVFDRPRSKRDPVHRKGSSVPQNGGNGPPTVETGVLFIEGCGVPQNGGNGIVLERYGRNGGPVHREGCGVPQNGTPQANVHPPSTASLKPPRATIHPLSTSSNLHLLLFIHHRLPPASTSYCSSM